MPLKRAFAHARELNSEIELIKEERGIFLPFLLEIMGSIVISLHTGTGMIKF